MRTSRIVAIGAAGIAAALALGGCSSAGTGGSGGSSSAPGTIGKVDGSGRTLTVWAMTGDLSDATLAAIMPTQMTTSSSGFRALPKRSASTARLSTSSP